MIEVGSKIRFERNKKTYEGEVIRITKKCYYVDVGEKKWWVKKKDVVEIEENIDTKIDDISINKIYNLDCITYLKKIKNKQINSIILDPPYFQVVNEKWDNQWNSFEEYLKWFENIIIELNRISKYSCSCWLFGYPYQLSYIIPLFEKHGFSYKQHITLNKGIQSVAGRVSKNIKMFPTASEYIIYFYKDYRNIIKNILQKKKKEYKYTCKYINTILGKATNGGGTWSTIAGENQKNIQYPTKSDWDKLDKLFNGFDIKYEDYVYKFYLPLGITDIWDDIKFYDKTYKNIWKEKYKTKCNHKTMKPYKLIERIINCSTDKNDIVLDIFMGTGMTGKVCKDLGRNIMGCEIDKNYVIKSLFYI